jgi:hypothetical protein
MQPQRTAILIWHWLWPTFVFPLLLLRITADSVAAAAALLR